MDQVVDALLTRSNDLKNNIQQLIWRLENEYETLQWPAVLDNFALISGQMNNLLKVTHISPFYNNNFCEAVIRTLDTVV